MSTAEPLAPEKSMKMRGYHFTDGLRLRDGRPLPPIGEWLVHEGSVVPCESGLHVSEHPFDALMYAVGSVLHRVELEGDLVPHGEPVDKWCGRRRRIIATIDATGLLHEFARWCALQVIGLWDTPPVVRQYLETGDESKRAAAWAAAGDTGNAAWTAAWAAGEPPLDAARDTASAAREAAGQAAARVARWDALSAAGEAARAAAMSAQRAKFAEMVAVAFAAAQKNGGKNDHG